MLKLHVTISKRIQDAIVEVDMTSTNFDTPFIHKMLDGIPDADTKKYIAGMFIILKQNVKMMDEQFDEIAQLKELNEDMSSYLRRLNIQYEKNKVKPLYKLARLIHG